MDFKILENLNSNLCPPSARNLYLNEASKKFRTGNVLDSVFYQTNSLTIGFKNKYFSYIPGEFNFRYPRVTKNVQANDKNKEPGPWAKFAKSVLKETKTSNYEKADMISFETDPKTGIEWIMDKCRKLPEEWNVIQLCKGFNPDVSFSLECVIPYQIAPIYITLLKHPRTHDKTAEPVCIEVQPTGIIQATFTQIIQSIREKCEFKGQYTTEDKAKYWKELKELKNQIDAGIEDLQKSFSPWHHLFSGNIATHQKHIEKEIFQAVDEFCERENFDTRFNILLSAFAIQIQSISSKDMISIAVKLDTPNENARQRVVDFLSGLKKRFTEKLQYMPCILIVDELLDMIFWETLALDKEICRMSSFGILINLFEKYKNKISHGYLRKSVKYGHSVINPDKTLPKMEKRMKIFFDYWLPKWSCKIGETLSNQTLPKYLTGDVYVYSGHGSGLQFVTGHKITKMEMSCITFLFGCESIKLKSDGLHSEMTGAHLYYHAASCPAIVGCLVTALDFELDLISSNILSEWIPSEQKIHWANIDKRIWRKDEEIQKCKSQAKATVNKYEPRLPLIVTKIRSEASEDFSTKAFVVYRGLPAWNCDAEQIL